MENVKRFFTRAKAGDDILFIVFALAFTAFATVVTLPLVSEYLQSADHDSHWYIAIAEGHIGEVLRPFSGRFLHPFLAGLLSAYFSLDIGTSFLLIAAPSLFFFLIAGYYMLKSAISSAFAIAPLFILPYFFSIYREFFVPDVFYIFLTALFLLFISRRMEGWGLVVLFLLFLARESTVLLGVILLAIQFLRGRKMLFAATLAVIAISIFTAGRINDLGLPNAHGLGGITYLALKAPFNFANNFLGAEPWINTLDYCAPVVKFNLPPWPVFGSVREIGSCGFDASSPLRVAVSFLATFGILPLVFARVFFPRFKSVLKEAPAWVVIALIYGVASFVVGSFISTGFERVMGYGWPAFLLATPILFQKFFRPRKEIVIKLFALHIFVAWLPAALGIASGNYAIGMLLLAIAFSVAAYAYASRLLKKEESAEGV